MTGATVFRRSGPAWRFEQQGNYLEHRTRTGSVYVIQFDNGDEYFFGGKPP